MQRLGSTSALVIVLSVLPRSSASPPATRRVAGVQRRRGLRPDEADDGPRAALDGRLRVDPEPVVGVRVAGWGCRAARRPTPSSRGRRRRRGPARSRRCRPVDGRVVAGVDVAPHARHVGRRRGRVADRVAEASGRPARPGTAGRPAAPEDERLAGQHGLAEVEGAVAAALPGGLARLRVDDRQQREAEAEHEDRGHQRRDQRRARFIVCKRRIMSSRTPRSSGSGRGTTRASR